MHHVPYSIILCRDSNSTSKLWNNLQGVLKTKVRLVV